MTLVVAPEGLPLDATLVRVGRAWLVVRAGESSLPVGTDVTMGAGCLAMGGFGIFRDGTVTVPVE